MAYTPEVKTINEKSYTITDETQAAAIEATRELTRAVQQLTAVLSRR